MFFFFKQKTAYEMRSSDWSSDVCSSDLQQVEAGDMSFGSQVAEQSHDRLWVAARDFRESGAHDVEKIDRSHIGPVPAPPIPDTVLGGKLLILARAFHR